MWIETSESWGLWGFPGCGRLLDSLGLDPHLCEFEKLPVRLIPAFSVHGQGLHRRALPPAPFLLAAAMALWQVSCHL